MKKYNWKKRWACAVFPTWEEALGAQVADAKPQDGQLVQARYDIFGEGQEAGEPVQLRVQAVTVAFGWVGFGAFDGGRFDSGNQDIFTVFLDPSLSLSGLWEHYWGFPPSFSFYIS